VVLVGDADKFVNDLKGVGFGSFERIPIANVDLLSPDLMRRSPRVAAFATPVIPVAPARPAVAR